MQQDLAIRREWLAALERGGTRERPIEVGSAAVVEVRVGAMSCPRCGIGSYRIAEHVAPGAALRRVDVACRQCSVPRSLWFRLVEREAS